MLVEPVELGSCEQEGEGSSPSFCYFILLFFYIGACNSPDKLLTIYIYPTIPRIRTRILLSIPNVRNMVLKFRPNKSSCIFFRLPLGCVYSHDCDCVLA